MKDDIPQDDTDSKEDDMAATDTSSKKPQPGRRLEDGSLRKDPTHKLNLDRRIHDGERRTWDDPKYRGPARRLTLDRRNRKNDRRKKTDT